MSRRKEIALVTAASAGLMANISSQKFYVNEECIPLQAYEINGSNYVKLRDIGQALDFSVTYAAKTNTVRINPNKPYEEGVAPPPHSAKIRTAPPMSPRMVAGTSRSRAMWSATTRTTSRTDRRVPFRKPPATGADSVSRSGPRLKSGGSTIPMETTSSSVTCTRPAGCSTASTTPWARTSGSCRVAIRGCGETEHRGYTSI